MLKQYLKNCKLSQRVVAQQLGVSQQLVSFWCSGKCEPKISQLKPLCQMLKVDLETLIGCFENESV